jgi:hypothetical protein
MLSSASASRRVEEALPPDQYQNALLIAAAQSEVASPAVWQAQRTHTLARPTCFRSYSAVKCRTRALEFEIDLAQCLLVAPSRATAMSTRAARLPLLTAHTCVAPDPTADSYTWW